MMQPASAVGESLVRIENGDVALGAWAFVATNAANVAPLDGPLCGVPFGVKDIIDVARMPTAFGLWREHRKARLDAWCVAALRIAGAVPVGKTRTTAHAYRDPAPTQNPLDPARTPGGSSAGSAAAVAAGHVPFALGTQTIGSVLRPAAYCGVVGYKPTWGRIPAHGVAPLAPSLDHVGVLAVDVAWARQVAEALIPALAADAVSDPRIAVASSVFDARFEPATLAAVRGAIDRLRAAGWIAGEETLPSDVDVAPADADVVTAYEAHANLLPLLSHALPSELRALLLRGEATPRERYQAALAGREAARQRLHEVIAGYDAVIVPGADAAPPRASTGDGAPFAPWSLYGVPAITIPIPGTAPAAVGLQLIAPYGNDARLLTIAALIEAALR